MEASHAKPYFISPLYSSRGKERDCILGLIQSIRKILFIFTDDTNIMKFFFLNLLNALVSNFGCNYNSRADSQKLYNVYSPLSALTTQ